MTGMAEGDDPFIELTTESGEPVLLKSTDGRHVRLQVQQDGTVGWDFYTPQ